MFVVNGCLTEHEPCHPNCRGWDPFNLPKLADTLGSVRDHSEIMRCDDCCADMGADYNDGHAVIDAARWAREVILLERVGADLGAVLACLANTDEGRAALYQAFDTGHPYLGPFYGPPAEAV